MAQKNPFPGVNPYLNRFMQQPGGEWHSLHAEYNGELRRHLDRILPNNYYAALESSLQVGIRDEEAVVRSRTSLTVGDVTIRGQGEAGIGVLTAPTPTLILPLEPLVLEDEDELSAVVVYTLKQDVLSGNAVTRFETLSPSNKPGGKHYAQYLQKRIEFLNAGLRLVEIDFLDLSHPIDARIPKYLKRESGAYPYLILMTDPRGKPDQRVTLIYGFGVLDRIPTIPVPLNGADQIDVDFGAVYQGMYDSSRLLQDSSRRTPLPFNFHRYTDADQAAIRAHIERIASQPPSTT